MKPDMSKAHAPDGNPDINNMLGDSDQPATADEYRADAIADPEKGQESSPQEKEEQVRAITGFKVGDTHQSNGQSRPRLVKKLTVHLLGV